MRNMLSMKYIMMHIIKKIIVWKLTVCLGIFLLKYMIHEGLRDPCLYYSNLSLKCLKMKKYYYELDLVLVSEASVYHLAGQWYTGWPVPAQESQRNLPLLSAPAPQSPSEKFQTNLLRNLLVSFFTFFFTNPNSAAKISKKKKLQQNLFRRGGL